jgi:hypothetical protein
MVISIGGSSSSWLTSVFFSILLHSGQLKLSDMSLSSFNTLIHAKYISECIICTCPPVFDYLRTMLAGWKKLLLYVAHSSPRSS